MNVLSDNLRDLMDRRKMTGTRLAEEIGISATSVSQILTGKTRPRQVTLSRMMKRLCENSADEQALLAAYDALGRTKLKVTPVFDDEANAATEEERVRRFLEMKATAVAFRKEVAKALNQIPIRYQSDFTKGAVITDCLIEQNGKRIALECRANVQRDLEKSLLSARIIRDEFKCDQVLIVVPSHDEKIDDLSLDESEIKLLALRNLAETIGLSLK